MTKLCSTNNCSGCSACAKSCPKQAITMVPDNMGFEYPKVDKSLCVKCGICERVCRELTEGGKTNVPLEYCSYQGTKETRLNSSSGGLFYDLAIKAIEKDFVVCGVVFNENFSSVYFAVAESREQLNPMRNSKYIAVTMQEIYPEVYERLKNGKNLLFFGLPCHIVGLQTYLNNKKRFRGKLVTVDMLCHGVGAPHIWNLALDDFCQRQGSTRENLVEVNFRSKPETEGKRLLLLLLLLLPPFFIAPKEFPYYYGFENRLILREACYRCKYRSVNRVGDITIGDMLPIDAEGLGRSVVLVNSEVGRNFLHGNIMEGFDLLTTDEISALHKRITSAHLSIIPKYRKKIKKNVKNYSKLKRTYLNPFYISIKYKIKRIIKKLLCHKEQ